MDILQKTDLKVILEAFTLRVSVMAYLMAYGVEKARGRARLDDEAEAAVYSRKAAPGNAKR
jgi:hypothetical protein